MKVLHWFRYAIAVAICILIALPVIVLFCIRCLGAGLIRLTDWMATNRTWSRWLFECAEAVEDWGNRK